MRYRYYSLLQILGCLGVIAYHSNLPGAMVVWPAVELFFALAAINMFRNLSFEMSFWEFARKRYQRFILLILLVFPLAAIVGHHAHLKATGWFLCLGPLLLHNFIPLRIIDWINGDMVWVPLWFLGALFQLQLLAFIFRHALKQAPILLIIAATVLIGTTGRLLIWYFLTSGSSLLSDAEAASLFWSPFCHVEVFVFSTLIALRGTKFGDFLFPAFGAVVIAGAIHAYATNLNFSSLGFPPGLPNYFQFLWGYPLLALLFASLVDPSNALSRWIAQRRFSSRADFMVEHLSRETGYAYAIHGSMLFLLWKIPPWRIPLSSHGRMYEVVITGIAIALSFLFAAALRGHIKRILPSS